MSLLKLIHEVDERNPAEPITPHSAAQIMVIVLMFPNILDGWYLNYDSVTLNWTIISAEEQIKISGINTEEMIYWIVRHNFKNELDKKICSLYRKNYYTNSKSLID